MKKQIILIGPPNSGKTSVFNWLTGFKKSTFNYPGSTVLLSHGKLLPKYNLEAKVTDSPGIYSLTPGSEDEKASISLIEKRKKEAHVVLVLDASKLEVGLPLFFKLKEENYDLSLILTMPDLVSLDISSLEKELGTVVSPINGLTGKGVFEFLENLQKRKDPVLKEGKKETWNESRLDQIGNLSKKITEKVSLKSKDNPNFFLSKRWDQFFLHPRLGFVFFITIMFGLFSSIFWLATPFMDLIDQGFSYLISWTSNALSPWPYVADFVSQGIVASFGSVLIFTPQIFILFVGISLLQDTGYLARAVTLLDGPLSKIGLSGRSFVPFLMGYACAIPAILLARNLKSKKERNMVFFTVPLMSCSARLPVYTLLLSFLFYKQASWKPALALGIIYLGSLCLGLLSVVILNLFLKKEKRESFLIDLPLYRRPSFSKVIGSAFDKTRHYVEKAGPAIFVVALSIWTLCQFPLNPELSEAERLRQSYAGRIGSFIEPIFSLMGVDWRVGTCLIAAFAAREVFVSALILLFLATSEGSVDSLLSTMKGALNSSGELIFTLPSVMALVCFFMIALQCLATTAIVYKESRSLKLALTQLVLFNVIAYALAVLVYQVLKLF